MILSPRTYLYAYSPNIRPKRMLNNPGTDVPQDCPSEQEQGPSATVFQLYVERALRASPLYLPSVSEAEGGRSIRATPFGPDYCIVRLQNNPS